MAAACFRPAAPQTLLGAAAYFAYLAWVSLHFVEVAGTTTFVHLLVAAATLGAWVGGCLRRVRGWPTVVLVPGYGAASAVPALVVACGGFACIATVAWHGGIAPWPFAAVGVLALSASVVAGLVVPGAATVGLVAMWLLAVPRMFWRPDAVDFHAVAPDVAWLAGAAVGTVGLAWLLAFPGRFERKVSEWRDRWPATGIARNGALWPPSLVRVASVFGALAVGAALVQRMLGADLLDETWVVLTGGLCVATAGASGTSLALPRGALAGASWLLLLGAAGRAGVGRRVQRRILGDVVVATAVFAAAAVALGLDTRLVEMVLLGFGCSGLYAAGAARSRWLMAGRASALVAAPVVVAMAGAAWTLGLQGLPATLGVWIAGAVAAVFLGGTGIGRLDLDFGLTGETTRQ